MKKLEICLVTETYPPEINGVAMTLGRVVEGLTHRGHRLSIVAPKRQDRPEGSLPYGTLHSVRGMRLPRYPELRFGFPSARRLEHLWRTQRPDLVHVATEGPLGWSAVTTARRMGIPLVTSYHTNFHRYGAHYGFGLAQRPVLAWLRHIHGQACRTFVPSDDVKDSLEASHFPNLNVLSRGVDTSLFHPGRRNPSLRQSWGASETTPVAIYVGRVADEKNVPLSILAWKAMRETLPDLKMVVVGDGPKRGKLERRHPDIVFTGMKTGKELARCYASGDIFLFGSTTETFGNVVTEALASGLVVLAYSYAAPLKFIRSGINGALAPFGDSQAFLRAASKLARNRRSWPAMRAAARETVMSASWNSVLDGFENTLLEISGTLDTTVK